MSSKGYFENIAGEWDTMRQDFFSEDVREKAYTIANVQAGKLAADIGAGSGFVTEGLLARGVKVIAVDQSEAMLGQIKHKFGHTELIECRLGEAEKLPIEDEGVDYVFANMYLHHVETPAIAIIEMTRILKQNGKLIITDLDEHDFAFLREEQYDRWMGFRREDVSKWFTEAGLKNVKVDCVGSNCCAQSTCGCDKASISIFVAYGEK